METQYLLSRDFRLHSPLLISLSLLLLAIAYAPNSQALSCYAGSLEPNCLEVCKGDADCKNLSDIGMIEQCRDRTAKTTCDTASICWLNHQGKQLCQEITRSNPYMLKSVQIKSTPDSISQVLARIYKPNATEETALKRLQPTDTLAEFPNGYILLPQKYLRLPTAVGKGEQIQSFTLREAGKTTSLVHLEKTNSKITIPTKALNYDRTYEWSAITDKSSYSGEFSVAEEVDQQDYKIDLAERLSHSDKSEHSKLMVEAVLAREYGFTYDSEQAIKKIKHLLSKGVEK